MNLFASLKIFLSHQAVYYYLLDNPVSGPSFVPTVIAALHPSNIKKAFEDKNETANAIHDINQLQQGTMKANELIIRFKLLLSKTSISTSNNN